MRNKEEIKTGRKYDNNKSALPEWMVYVYKTEMFPESESPGYTTESNKKANRKK